MPSAASLLASIACLAAAQPQRKFEDETCLIQHQLHFHKKAGIAPSKDDSLASDAGTFDCDKHPGLCKAPFNCQSFTAEESSELETRGAAVAGRANPRAWCMAAYTSYAPYAELCLGENRDLVKAGHVQHERTKKGLYHGTSSWFKDGSSCFVEGHCVNDAVTANTTLAEAEDLCDAKYGRQAWTTHNQGSQMWEASVASWKAAHGPNGEFSKLDQTTPFTLTACAMGHYHCDVVYCKETYCKNQNLVRRYGHFLHEMGWMKKEQYMQKFGHLL